MYGIKDISSGTESQYSPATIDLPEFSCNRRHIPKMVSFNVGFVSSVALMSAFEMVGAVRPLSSSSLPPQPSHVSQLTSASTRTGEPPPLSLEDYDDYSQIPLHFPNTKMRYLITPGT